MNGRRRIRFAFSVGSRSPRPQKCVGAPHIRYVRSMRRTNRMIQGSLVTPMVDMWLVGGSSLAALAIFWIFAGGVFHLDRTFQFALWAYYASFVSTYPHFAYSYMLFYPGFFRRFSAPEATLIGKIRLGVAGFLVPSLMLGYFIWAWHMNPKYLGWAALAMYFFVGWHYVMQGYGSLITLSLYKNVFYSVLEKRAFNANAYAIWISSWTSANSSAYTQYFHDVSYTTFSYPSWLVHGCFILGCLTTAIVMGLLLVRLLYNKQGIPFSAVLGYGAAIYMWIMFPYVNMVFYLFISFFHGLQYLPFVYKFKKSECIQAQPAASLVGFTIVGIILGAVFLELMPKYIDKHFWIQGRDPQFFLISFGIFINIHHFFIDHAFWRRDNPDVQRYLFRA
jgi:hypothetical protein